MTFDKIDGACSLYNKTAYAQDDSLFLIEGDEHEEVDTSLYAEIDAEVTRLQAEYDAQQYARDRQYPALGDQLDALFHAGVFPAEMAAEIQAVKDKYPK